MKFLLKACLLFLISAVICLPLPAMAQTVTVLHSFNAAYEAMEGVNPTVGLVQDTVPSSPTFGDFYGTTGASQGIGVETVYLVTPLGVEETLYTFGSHPNDAFNSLTPLAQDTNPNSPTYGDFYGTSQNGGANSFGTVYLITPTSASTANETVVYSFGSGANDSIYPETGLTQDTIPSSPTFGDFYGTAGTGNGTVYLITPGSTNSASEHVLYYFGSKATLDGNSPDAQLVQDTVPTSPTYGDFYGTTALSSFDNFQFNALVYLIAPTSPTTANESNVYQFGFNGENDGEFPRGGLVQDLDQSSPTFGSFYGTTLAGGSAGSGSPSLRNGTVYVVTPTGSSTVKESVIYSFGSQAGDGSVPMAPLTQDLNPSSPTFGDFLGTTQYGGSTGNGSQTSGSGTIFEITPSGSNTAVESILHSFLGFPATDGSIPEAGLVQDRNPNSPAYGSFYGTTVYGGIYDWGTAFALTFPPHINSLVPNPVLAGGPTFSLAVNGSSFEPGATVNFNDSPLQTTWTSANQVNASVPANDIEAAGTAQITVSNPASLFINNPSPAITSLSPTSVPENSGDFTLTINGSGFNSSTTVNFGGNVITPASVTPSVITVDVPNADIQTPTEVTVIVTNPGPGGGSANTVFTVTSPPPTITALSPSSAIANSGSFTLTITGNNFTPSSTVTFGSDKLTPTSETTTTLTVTVPNSDISTAGTVTVTVSNPFTGGGTATANFSVNNIPAPAITSLSPATATANSGDFTLTINGSGFNSSSAVSFGGSSLTPTSVTSSAITVTVPNADIQTVGTIVVTVSNPAPGGGSASANFTVSTSTLAINSLSPSSTAVNSGDFTLTINGTGFTSNTSVSFNGNALTPTSQSPTAITVTVPNADIQTAGIVPVIVSNPGFAFPITATANFTIIGPPPTITSLSPASVGVNSGDFTLIINGSGFNPSSTVSFGGNALTPTSITSTAITMTVPNADIGTIGTVTVSVTNPGVGGSTATANFTITNTTPTISSLSPEAEGTNSGDFALTINGLGFTQATTVTFNGNPLTPTSQSETVIAVTVPNADIQTAGMVPVSATNPGTGGGTGSANFSIFNLQVSISSLSPSTVEAQSGPFALTINGTGFCQATSVTVGGVAVAVTSMTATALTVTVPNSVIQNGGNVQVEVTNPPANQGLFAVATLVVTSNPNPTVTSLSPSTVTGNSGTFSMTITGTGYIPATTVTLEGTQLTITSQTSTTLVVTVPNSLIQTGGQFPVTITNPAPGGGSINGNLGVIVGTPLISSFSPPSVVANSGTFTLTINGSNYVQSTTVTFNGNALTPTSLTETAITVIVPNADIQSPGTVPVNVSTPGASGSSANFTITAPNNPAPTITSLNPSSTTANSGSFTLTINGSGFIPTSTVTFGGNALTPTAVTSSAITVTVPNAAIQTAGTVTVTVTNPAPGGGAASANFTVQAASNLGIQSLTVSPSAVPGGTSAVGTVTLTGMASTNTTINVTTTLAAATIVGPVVVPAGKSSTTFTINTTGVSPAATGTITASLNGTSQSATLKILSAEFIGFSISPSTVKGGVGTATLTATLSAAAGPAGFTISLASTDQTVLPLSQMTVPPGAISGTLTLSPGSVSSSETITITGTSFFKRTVTLTVTP